MNILPEDSYGAFTLTESDSDILSHAIKWVHYPFKSEQIYISESEPVCQFLHTVIISIIIGSERISDSKSDSVSGIHRY